RLGSRRISCTMSAGVAPALRRCGRTARLLVAVAALRGPTVTEPFELHLEIGYLRQINWSLLHAGIPPVWQLRLTNNGSGRARGLRCRGPLPGCVDSGPVNFPPIEPQQKHPVDLSRVRWVRRNVERAMQITVPRQTAWQVEVGAHSAQLPVQLLAPDEW